MKITYADLDTVLRNIFKHIFISKRKVYKSTFPTKLEVEAMDSVNFDQCRAFLNFEVT